MRCCRYSILGEPDLARELASAGTAALPLLVLLSRLAAFAASSSARESLAAGCCSGYALDSAALLMKCVVQSLNDRSQCAYYP